MRWLLMLSFLLLLRHNVCKEASVYKVSGIQLFDLIRGYAPDEGLKLTKVEGDRASLPDGIYYQPEDEALTDPEEAKYLYLNGFKKKSTKEETTED